MSLTAEQREALRTLAVAYSNLSNVWDSSWEGPDNFGGHLSDLGVLPTLSLDEAGAELMSLATDEGEETICDLENPIFDVSQMLSFAEKDRYLRKVLTMMTQKGHSTELALEVLFNENVLGDSAMIREYEACSK